MAAYLIDPALLDILACPDEHHAPLVEIAAGSPDGGTEGALQCTQCHLVFPIRDGIPVLLLDDAVTPAV